MAMWRYSWPNYENHQITCESQQWHSSKSDQSPSLFDTISDTVIYPQPLTSGNCTPRSWCNLLVGQTHLSELYQLILIVSLVPRLPISSLRMVVPVNAHHETSMLPMRAKWKQAMAVNSTSFSTKTDVPMVRNPQCFHWAEWGRKADLEKLQIKRGGISSFHVGCTSHS